MHSMLLKAFYATSFLLNHMFLDMVKLRRFEHTLIDLGQEMQTHCTLSKALLKSIAYHADLLDPIN